MLDHPAALAQADHLADDASFRDRNETRPLGPADVVELYAGVNVGRSRMWATGGVVQPQSVMGEAPTMALRKFTG